MDRFKTCVTAAFRRRRHHGAHWCPRHKRRSLNQLWREAVISLSRFILAIDLHFTIVLIVGRNDGFGLGRCTRSRRLLSWLRRQGYVWLMRLGWQILRRLLVRLRVRLLVLLRMVLCVRLLVSCLMRSLVGLGLRLVSCLRVRSLVLVHQIRITGLVDLLWLLDLLDSLLLLAWLNLLW